MTLAKGDVVRKMRKVSDQQTSSLKLVPPSENEAYVDHEVVDPVFYFTDYTLDPKGLSCCLVKLKVLK